jgi:cell division protease FtsH
MLANMGILHNVAAILLEKENIDGDEFNRIIIAAKAQQYLKDDAPGVTIPYQA